MSELPASFSFETAQARAMEAWHEENFPNPPAPSAPEAASSGPTGYPAETGDFTQAQATDGLYEQASPIFESFSNALTNSGVQVERMADARAWIDTLQGDVGNPTIAHGFDIRGYQDSFTEQDQPILTSFLNHAAGAGWTQDEVNSAVKWYQQWSADAAQGEIESAHEATQVARDTESVDAQDRDHARDVLRELWGEEFDANRNLVNQHLDRLPANEREFYESTDETGTLRLNRPEILERLARDARATVSADTRGAITAASQDFGSEKAALEAMMANPRSAYWKGADSAALQARYRDLISSGDTGNEKPLPQGSGINAEINKIEHVMKTDRRRYNRDEQMQQRYRDLLELRG